MPCFSWIVWIVFSGNGRQPPFSAIWWPLRCQIWPTWPKNESILNSHPKNVQFELDCVNTFSYNGRKTHFHPLLSNVCSLEGQNWANVTQNQTFLNTHPTSLLHKIEFGCVNTLSDNGQKPLFWPIPSFFCPPKVGQHRSQANQFWTLTQQMHRINL